MSKLGKKSRYPWSDMPMPLLRLLAGAHPDMAAERGAVYLRGKGVDFQGGIPDDFRYGDVDRTVPAMITMSGVSRWLNGDRSIIDISAMSGKLLGDWEPRFEGLPVIPESPWKKGTVFCFEEWGCAMYVEPLDGEEPGIRYAVWIRDAHGTWGTVLPRHLGSTVLTVPGTLEIYNRLDHSLGTKSTLAIGEFGDRVPLGKIRRVAVNALSALNEDPQILLGKRKAPRHNRRKRMSLKAAVQNFTLSHDGARLVMRRWAVDSSEPQTEKIEHSQHKSPCLHTVQPHKWRIWVNTPEVNEVVIETREKQRTTRKGDVIIYTQYRVSRLRGKDGSYARGKGTPERRSRIIVGPEDLNTGRD